LIRSAKRELFIVSFVAYDVPSVVKTIRDALERGVEVRMLLESSEENGGTLSMDPTAMMKSAIPGMKLYAWKEREGEHSRGKVHAKICVADSCNAFITSANLTGYALEKNMEAGVLIKGGGVPSNLRAHLHALIEIGMLRLV
ncbi:MAG: DISARM system phospholipase D-like protein DrmC, partial [Rectinema sp.]